MHNGMVKLRMVVLFFLFVAKAPTGYGQEPVAWSFRATPVAGNETTVIIQAHVAPGWHLYSQRIKEGGPRPTRFSFEGGANYVPIGVTEEKGNAAVFYEEVYEMDITWYTGSVTFSQRFRLNKPDVTIEGIVVYMTCNNDVCIPAEKEFTINTSP